MSSEFPTSPSTPTIPSPQESAATLLAGMGAARIARPGPHAEASPVLHGLSPTGEVVLVLAGCDLPGLGLDREPVAQAVLDVVSAAPVPDLHLPRAGLRSSGRVRLLAAHRARSALLAAHCPAQDLRTAAEEWSAAVVAVFTPQWTTLHAHGRCAAVGRVAADQIDPLAGQELELVHLLDVRFGADLLPLVRRFDTSADPASQDLALREVTRVRVVGADRFGLSLLLSRPRAESVSLRLGFPAPVRSGQEAVRAVTDALGRLRTCLRGECTHCTGHPRR